MPEGKTRIYFEANTDGKFEILDRIADRDGALISVPVTNDDNRWITLDLWIRVVGKPNTCAEIDGYAFEQGGNPNGGPICRGILVRSFSITRRQEKANSSQATGHLHHVVLYCESMMVSETLICDDDPQRCFRVQSYLRQLFRCAASSMMERREYPGRVSMSGKFSDELHAKYFGPF